MSRNTSKLIILFVIALSLLVTCASQSLNHPRFKRSNLKIKYPYYERPPYRYPVYDSSGKGQLLYGYGGSEVYQYTKFSPLEGIYKR